MTAFPPSRTVRALLSVTVATALAVSGVRGQISTEPPAELPPVEWGPINLYPLAEIEASSTDNLFYQSDASLRTATEIGSATLGALFDLPFSHSYSRLGMAAKWRAYSTDELDDNVSYFAAIDTELVFSNGFHTRFSDTFENGVLDTQLLNGGELTFEGEKFKTNDATLEFGYARSKAWDVRMIARGYRSEFDRDGPAQFYDVNSDELGLKGWHQIGPRARVVWDASVDRTDFDRPPDADFTADSRRSDSRTVRGGLEMEISPLTYLYARLGWRHQQFESTLDSTYDGPVADIRLRRRIVHGPLLMFSIQRDVYPSVYQDNDYFQSWQATGELSNPLDGRMLYGIRGSAFRYEYPQSGPTRDDDSWNASLWVGYRIRPWLAWKVELQSRRRHSTIDTIDYDVTAVATSLTLGRR